MKGKGTKQNWAEGKLSDRGPAKPWPTWKGALEETPLRDTPQKVQMAGDYTPAWLSQ